jgi:hypothetical protein
MFIRLLLGLMLNCFYFFVSAQIITDDVPTPNGHNRSKNDGKPERQFFLLFNLGMASPTGIFGSNDILNDEAVYALPGINLNANVGRTFNRYLGITATGGFILQNTRMAELVDNYNRFNINNETILDYEYPGMRFLYATGGFLLSIPATNIFVIDVKMQAGIALGIDRELTLQIEDLGGIYLLKYGKAADIAFAPNLGLNFRLLVTQKFTMNFFTDFISANFKYRGIPVSVNGIAVDNYNYELPMRNINVGIGAGWSFN